jgi:two-component system, LytTR family, response regulator
MSTVVLKAVVIEDEEESLQLLSNLILSTGKADVVGSASDPTQALDLIIGINPDIVFLDIKMPGKSGFDILDDLRNVKSVNPYVVFTTAYDEFAVRAFEYAAFDYLLKPVDQKRLAATLLRCIDERLSGSNQQNELLLNCYRKLQFRNSSGIVFIDPADIAFIEADGNYSVIHLSGSSREVITLLLGKVEEQLSPDAFFRISRSSIINLNFLKKINTRQSQCILNKNGSEFKCDISRDRISTLAERMRNR